MRPQGKDAAMISEILGLMKYRKFWHRDHEKKVDVVCILFDFEIGPKPDRKVLNNPTEEAREFVRWLASNEIQAYVHYGPTGAVFAAIVCNDTNRSQLESLQL